MQFSSDDAMYTWLEKSRALQPSERTFKLGTTMHDIWTCKEQSLGRREAKAFTMHAAGVIRQHFSQLRGWDPQDVEVLYTANAVWHSEIKVCESRKRTDPKAR